jgi:hypothetical protein
MSNTRTEVTLSGATWTQHAEEINELIGVQVVTTPPRAECGESSTTPGHGSIDYRIDVEGGVGFSSTFGPGEASSALPIKWIGAPATEHGASQSELLFEPAKTVTHTLHAFAQDTCGENGGGSGGHFTIDSISIDVLAFK